MPIKSAAYGALSASAKLTPLTVDRRDLGAHDVWIDIEYCGVCHSDIHTARNEWGGARYPVVPGHEIVGRVRSVGAAVSRFKVGERVGVGCLVDSCRHCHSCEEGLEQFCTNGMVGTYGSKEPVIGGPTFGGYSENIIVDENYVLRVDERLDPAAVAPLLCAGITTWSPLRHWKIKAGDKVGIIGLGGLGHMGIKFAKAMGAHTVMITTSPSKAEDARRLGADEVLLSTDKAAMAAAGSSFDFLLNTVPCKHDINPYMWLLKRDATMVIVGALEHLNEVDARPMVFARRHVSGSLIGGIAETQEMLDFCAEHNVVSDIEMIDMKDINAAWDRVVKADVKYRFVIDMKSLSAN